MRKIVSILLPVKVLNLWDVIRAQNCILKGNVFAVDWKIFLETLWFFS